MPEATEVELRRLHPGEPWRWRPEWRDGRIRSRDRARIAVLWLAALAWNGMTAPLVWRLPRELECGPRMLLLAGAFGLAGLWIVGAALRATLRQLRFGTARLDLDTVPGVIGGRLRGTIHVRGSLAGAARVELRLTCVNRVTSGSGKSRSTFEHVRWQEEYAVPRASLAAASIGSAIPVDFTLPYGLAPSRAEPSDNQILWRLEARAELAGADFHTRFEVPVFVTPESDPHVVATKPASPHSGDPTRFGGSGIRVEPLPDGGLRVHFPRLRQPVAGLVLCAFGGGFAAVAGFVGSGDAVGVGGILIAVFGGFGLLLLWAGLDTLLATTTVSAHPDGVSIRRGILFRPRRFVPAAQIARITLEIGMQIGDRAYYDLKVRTRSRRTRAAGSRIRSKREAEWLAERLRTAVGVRSEP
ncbi:MAG: hypothetical protein JSU66_14965 [Deltaproteobacteria bacterium]|nr:MAG: hypothetical protein JSU66_14965 [Deltaproteobacteria bacterium]